LDLGNKGSEITTVYNRAGIAFVTLYQKRKTRFLEVGEMEKDIRILLSKLKEERVLVEQEGTIPPELVVCRQLHLNQPLKDRQNRHKVGRYFGRCLQP
jgi:hypothetical protein